MMAQVDLRENISELLRTGYHYCPACFARVFPSGDVHEACPRCSGTQFVFSPPLTVTASGNAEAGKDEPQRHEDAKVPWGEFQDKALAKLRQAVFNSRCEEVTRFLQEAKESFRARCYFTAESCVDRALRTINGEGEVKVGDRRSEIGDGAGSKVQVQSSHASYACPSCKDRMKVYDLEKQGCAQCWECACGATGCDNYPEGIVHGAKDAGTASGTRGGTITDGAGAVPEMGEVICARCGQELRSAGARNGTREGACAPPAVEEGKEPHV